MIKSKYVEAHIRLWSSSNLRQNMKRVGNIASNRVYNPQNANPPIPLDVDEADSAMEVDLLNKKRIGGKSIYWRLTICRMTSFD